jgi:hypothetical protein
MADDSFRVKNTLVVNGAFVANSTVVNAAAISATSVNAGANVTINTTAVFVGNSSVNTNIGVGTISISGTIVNSSIYQGTANNANNLGGSSLSTIQSQITGNAATAYSNAVTVAATAYSNAVANSAALYQTTAGLTANVATRTANNTSFVGTVSAANVVSNAQLSSNLVNYQTTAGLSANVAALTANNTSFLGGTAAAGYQTTAGLSANVATLTANNSTNLNGQAASYYTNIPARLGYTPVNLAGDTMTGNFAVTAAQINIGTGQNEQKNLMFQNANRQVYFYLSSTTLGLYDGTGGANRWTTDTSGNFTATGNITAFSDIKLKANIRTIERALYKATQLRGVAYDRRSDGTSQIGVVAQEVREILPEVVIEDENGVLSVAYGNIVGLLIEAIKELSAKVDELEKRI